MAASTSPTPPSQENRLLAIDTELGADALLLRRFSITEQMGRLFQIEVEMDSTNDDINFEDIVGTSATIRLGMPNGNIRYFNGIVSRFVQEGQGDDQIYRATLSPSLWLLTRAKDCQIFQNQSVKQIISTILSDNGIQFDPGNLQHGTQPRDFCVQYRETSFDFVSRLMEEEGIYYYFKHQEGSHTLVLADSPSAHNAFPGYDTLDYGKVGNTTVTDWKIEKEIQPTLCTLNDFDFTVPQVVTANANISRTHENANCEVFDYPGKFTSSDDGDSYAKVRIEELQAQYEIVHANTWAYGVATGYKFELKGHPRSDQERDYLVLSMSLRAAASAYTSGDNAADEFFSCSFTAMPMSTNPEVSFRSPRTTPKPRIRGPQTAIVVASSDEITTDEYGRVQVQFHWDRKQANSCFIRVSQNWAGKGWGTMQLPRKDQEVIVEFLEGDPDQPIITGRVYNGEQVPPYALPGNKTQSGIMSRSTTGGGASNFNALWFEDKKGSEQVSLQAEKDMVVTIKNNHTEQTTKAYSLHADTVSITGQSKITLTVGSNSITIDSSGITINSGAGTVSAQAATSMTLKANASLEANTSGQMTIKGAIVQIN